MFLARRGCPLRATASKTTSRSSKISTALWRPSFTKCAIYSPPKPNAKDASVFPSLCLEPATVESGNPGVNNSLFGVTYCTDPDGTFEKSEPSPSAMVGWTRTASRSLPYGKFARIAVCTATMTSPASDPIIVKPRMRSSLPPTRAFMKPSVSPVASVRSTALIGNLATRTATPWRCASPSLSPTWASGGSVNRQYGTEPIARAALPSSQIVPDDSKVVDGYVRELGATGGFPQGPDTGCSRLQPLIDANVATTIQLNASLLKPNPSGVGNAPCRDQDVAAFDLLLTGGCSHGNADFHSGFALHIEGLSRH